ncbi:hypothetical protein FRC11_012736 [Ceratobasidium sp. 423]|nr:hypothetical protein FRC11_012736 [Ceratobasidium sp. 423]
MEDNGPSVVEIPELLASITLGLDTKEQRKLMVVSKHFFHSGAKVESHPTGSFPGYGPRGYEITITLPVSPDLSRYNIYASWVQELELFGKGSEEIINLHPFLTLLDGHPPLPNLQRLTAYNTIPISSNQVMGFINMFICPSLIDIRTVLHKDENGVLRTSRSRVSSSSVPAFLTNIKETCPRIRVLEFYPEPASADNHFRQYTPSDQCRSALSSFLNLRSFSSTTYILDPTVLSILGSLPHLESLGIRGSPIEHSVLDKQLSIPETWFPVLKDLRLYDVHHEDIQAIWNQPNIVKKLTSAVVQTDHVTPRSPPDDLLYGQNWIGPFLAALFDLSPRLQDVAFYMGTEDMRVEIPRESWGFISRGDVSPGDAYSMALWPDLDFSD